MNRDAMLSLLTADEGNRLKVYDDATGKEIVPGSVVIGHPTIGRGRALDTNGISEGESVYLCLNDIARIEREMDRAFPWWKRLSEKRQLVLASMVYQLGTGGVLGFPKFLAALKREDWPGAAAEMRDSLWFQQTPARCERLAKIMVEG